MMLFVSANHNRGRRCRDVQCLNNIKVARARELQREAALMLFYCFAVDEHI